MMFAVEAFAKRGWYPPHPLPSLSRSRPIDRARHPAAREPPVAPAMETVETKCLDIVDVVVQRLARPNSSSTGRSAARAADVERLPPGQEGVRVAGVVVAAAEEEVEGKA